MLHECFMKEEIEELTCNFLGLIDFVGCRLEDIDFLILRGTFFKFLQNLKDLEVILKDSVNTRHPGIQTYLNGFMALNKTSLWCSDRDKSVVRFR